MAMFKNAKVIAPAATKAKADTKLQVTMKKLEQFAELQALSAAIEAITSQLGSELKESAMDTFLEEGHKIERRPDNFRGVDGNASASVELRKRSTASPLTADQVALLAKFNMIPEKVITVNPMFGINPAYAEDAKLLEAVEAALTGIVPEDFIVQQEEKSKLVVTDKMVDQAFLKNVPREVVETVSVLALKPKLEVTDIKAILERAKAILA